MKWNVRKVFYIDCLRGMAKLPSNSIDLCLTDTSYNVKIGSSYPRKRSRDRGNDTDVYYDDSLTPEEYWKLNRAWFSEAKRICRHIIFTPGENNLFDWIEIEKPSGILYHYKRNGRSPGTMSRLILMDSILLYGIWNRKQWFRTNVFDIPLETKSNTPILKDLIHPCPKSYGLWKDVLNDYMNPVYGKFKKPNCVLDPFLGSGTTAQLCEEFDIPYICFEIKDEYRTDIERRIEYGKELKKMNDIRTVLNDWA